MKQFFFIVTVIILALGCSQPNNFYSNSKIQGKWISVDDEKWSWNFEENKLIDEYFDDYIDTLTFYIDQKYCDSLLKYPNVPYEDPDSTFFLIIFQADDVDSRLCYKIENISESNLMLYYPGRLKPISFRRSKE